MVESLCTIKAGTSLPLLASFLQLNNLLYLALEDTISNILPLYFDRTLLEAYTRTYTRWQLNQTHMQRVF